MQIKSNIRPVEITLNRIDGLPTYWSMTVGDGVMSMKVHFNEEDINRFLAELAWITWNEVYPLPEDNNNCEYDEDGKCSKEDCNWRTKHNKN